MYTAILIQSFRKPIQTFFVLMILFALILSPQIRSEKNDTILGPPPGTYKITAPDGKISIPFELYRGDLRINGKINGRAVRMLIDNGFLWDQILFFGSPRVDSLNLNIDGIAEVKGSGEGDPLASTTASGITISFPGIEFYDQTAIITPYSPGAPNRWYGAEGQVSATFFKHFVVDVNFDKMIITLTEPDRFEYRGKGIEILIKHVFKNSWSIPAEIEMNDGKILQLDLTMDLGYGDNLQLAEGFEHKLSVPSGAIEASLGFGAQGEVHGYIGRVKRVKIGPYKFDDVITAFVPESNRDYIFHETLIGMGILQRFNFVYDYPGHRMFLEPNHNFDNPFEYDMSGMALRRGHGDYMQIVTLYPDSPAERAGLKKGDKITKINGRPAIDYGAWDLMPVMQQEGKVVKLTVLKNGAENEVAITLRPII